MLLLPQLSARLKEKKKLEVEVEDNIKKNQLKDDNNNKNRAISYQVERICLSAHLRRKDRETNHFQNTPVRQYKFRYTIENAYFSVLKKVHSSDPGVRFLTNPLNHRECPYDSMLVSLKFQARRNTVALRTPAQKTKNRTVDPLATRSIFLVLGYRVTFVPTLR